MPKSAHEKQAEEKAKREHTELLSNMTIKERKQYEKDEEERAAIEADRKAEKMMIEAIAVEKLRLGKTDQLYVTFERVRGLVRLEDDPTQDYELIVHQQELTLRPLKNQAARIESENLGFMVYGKNVVEGENILRDILKVCRTLQP